LVRDGETVSLADYHPLDDGTTLVFDHTFTPPVHRDNGFAADLVGRALEDVRTRGHRVVATCWFVDQFIDEHPAYADLRA